MRHTPFCGQVVQFPWRWRHTTLHFYPVSIHILLSRLSRPDGSQFSPFRIHRNCMSWCFHGCRYGLRAFLACHRHTVLSCLFRKCVWFFFHKCRTPRIRRCFLLLRSTQLWIWSGFLVCRIGSHNVFLVRGIPVWPAAYHKARKGMWCVWLHFFHPPW